MKSRPGYRSPPLGLSDERPVQSVRPPHAPYRSGGQERPVTLETERHRWPSALVAPLALCAARLGGPAAAQQGCPQRSGHRQVLPAFAGGFAAHLRALSDDPAAGPEGAAAGLRPGLLHGGHLWRHHRGNSTRAPGHCVAHHRPQPGSHCAPGHHGAAREDWTRCLSRYRSRSSRRGVVEPRPPKRRTTKRLVDAGDCIAGLAGRRRLHRQAGGHTPRSVWAAPHERLRSSGRWLLPAPPSRWRRSDLLRRPAAFTVVAYVAAGVATIGYLAALASGPAAVVVPLVATSPALAGLAGIVFLHERSSRRQLMGIVLAVVGAVLLAAQA